MITVINVNEEGSPSQSWWVLYTVLMWLPLLPLWGTVVAFPAQSLGLIDGTNNRGMGDLEHSILLPCAPQVHSFTLVLIPEPHLGHLSGQRGLAFEAHSTMLILCFMEKFWTQAEVPMCNSQQIPLTLKRDPCRPRIHTPQSRTVNNPEQIADIRKICGERQEFPYTT